MSGPGTTSDDESFAAAIEAQQRDMDRFDRHVPDDLVGDFLRDVQAQRERDRVRRLIGISAEEFGKGLFGGAHAGGKALATLFGGGQLAQQVEDLESPILPSWAKSGGKGDIARYVPAGAGLQIMQMKNAAKASGAAQPLKQMSSQAQPASSPPAPSSVAPASAPAKPHGPIAFVKAHPVGVAAGAVGVVGLIALLARLVRR